jgi:hypothetical protein
MAAPGPSVLFNAASPDTADCCELSPMVDDWSTACSDALLVSQVISQANSRGKVVRNLPFMDATR